MSQYIRAKKSYLYIFLQFQEFHQMSIYQGKKILSLYLFAIPPDALHNSNSFVSERQYQGKKKLYLYLFAIPPYVPQLKFILFRKIDREKEMERDYLYSRYMSSLNQRERERERERVITEKGKKNLGLRLIRRLQTIYILLIIVCYYVTKRKLSL